jgi:ABC-type polar amino acid transport system ATPase subunit
VQEVVVEYQQVGLRYGSFQALEGVEERVYKGDVVVICGPSGSGKSSLLRCTNGLEGFQEGDIIVDGTSVKRCADLPRLRSRIGMVFQQFDLYPHLTCLRNVTLAPVKVLGWTRAKAEAKAEALLDRFGILGQALKYPAELSGGQQQRVAICRALALEPTVMMFDEPTSALDPEMIGEVLDVIRDLARDHMTMLIVTHEMRFAREIANRILFMESGRIVDRGSGRDFFDKPANPRTAQFLAKILG